MNVQTRYTNLNIEKLYFYLILLCKKLAYCINSHQIQVILITILAYIVFRMTEETIKEITILPGHNRKGTREAFDKIHIRPGDTLSIVGPTGSGKSAFINDIEIFANRDTVTGRQVLVNGKLPHERYVRDPAAKPVALITQNTRCLCDLIVSDFLRMHLLSRGNMKESCIQETINLANQFTGEPISAHVRMTSLSGGQTRSLMVADAILISNTPIILLDEVENAGIFKEKVIEVLRQHHKALLFVTHDPWSLCFLTDELSCGMVQS